MSKRLDISVVGLSCVDCVADAADRRWNVQNPVGDVRISAGGLGNAVVALSGLGLKVGVSTRIGNDMYGEFLLEEWRSLCMDTSGVRLDENRSTGFSFLVNCNGDRTPFYSAGANADFCLSDIPAELCESSRSMLVFFAGALPSLDGDPMLQLVKRCHAAGTSVIMDVCDGIIVDYAPVRSYMPYVNLVVNSEEGRRITGKETAHEMLDALVDMAGAPDCNFLAVTRPDGVSMMSPADGKWEYLDVPSPLYGRPVRDVVGAGDAFRAGLAAYISMHDERHRTGRLDYKELCLFGMAVSYSYLSRKTNQRPFSTDDVYRLTAGGQDGLSSTL